MDYLWIVSTSIYLVLTVVVYADYSFFVDCPSFLCNDLVSVGFVWIVSASIYFVLTILGHPFCIILRLMYDRSEENIVLAIF